MKQKQILSAAKEKQKETAGKLKQAQKDIKDKAKEISELKKKYKKHRQKNPDSELTKAWQKATKKDKSGRVQGDQLTKLLQNFATETGQPGVEEHSLTSTKDHRTTDKTDSAETFSYGAICRLRNWSIYDKENDRKLQDELDLGYITKAIRCHCDSDCDGGDDGDDGDDGRNGYGNGDGNRCVVYHYMVVLCLAVSRQLWLLSWWR